MRILTVRCMLCSAVLSMMACGENKPDAALDAGAQTPVVDASVPRKSVDDAAVSEADGFTVALSTSDCEGGCPIYDLKLDQKGIIELNGRGNTRQQGRSVKTVPPEAAAEILAALEAADYWKLRDVYRESSDGCSDVEAERATYTWNVRTDGPAKIVIDYQGCTGVRELEALRKVPALLIEKLALDSWLRK